MSIKIPKYITKFVSQLNPGANITIFDPNKHIIVKPEEYYQNPEGEKSFKIEGGCITEVKVYKIVEKLVKDEDYITLVIHNNNKIRLEDKGDFKFQVDSFIIYKDDIDDDIGSIVFLCGKSYKLLGALIWIVLFIMKEDDVKRVDIIIYDKEDNNFRNYLQHIGFEPSATPSLRDKLQYYTSIDLTKIKIDEKEFTKRIEMNKIDSSENKKNENNNNINKNKSNDDNNNNNNNKNIGKEEVEEERGEEEVEEEEEEGVPKIIEKKVDEIRIPIPIQPIPEYVDELLKKINMVVEVYDKNKHVYLMKKQYKRKDGKSLKGEKICSIDIEKLNITDEKLIKEINKSSLSDIKLKELDKSGQFIILVAYENDEDNKINSKDDKKFKYPIHSLVTYDNVTIDGYGGIGWWCGKVARILVWITLFNMKKVNAETVNATILGDSFNIQSIKFAESFGFEVSGFENDSKGQKKYWVDLDMNNFKPTKESFKKLVEENISLKYKFKLSLDKTAEDLGIELPQGTTEELSQEIFEEIFENGGIEEAEKLSKDKSLSKEIIEKANQELNFEELAPPRPISENVVEELRLSLNKAADNIEQPHPSKEVVEELAEKSPPSVINNIINDDDVAEEAVDAINNGPRLIIEPEESPIDELYKRLKFNIQQVYDTFSLGTDYLMPSKKAITEIAKELGENRIDDLSDENIKDFIKKANEKGEVEEEVQKNKRVILKKRNVEKVTKKYSGTVKLSELINESVKVEIFNPQLHQILNLSNKVYPTINGNFKIKNDIFPSNRYDQNFLKGLGNETKILVARLQKPLFKIKIKMQNSAVYDEKSIVVGFLAYVSEDEKSKYIYPLVGWNKDLLLYVALKMDKQIVKTVKLKMNKEDVDKDLPKNLKTMGFERLSNRSNNNNDNGNTIDFIIQKKEDENQILPLSNPFSELYEGIHIPVKQPKPSIKIPSDEVYQFEAFVDQVNDEFNTDDMPEQKNKKTPLSIPVCNSKVPIYKKDGRGNIIKYVCAEPEIN